MKLLEYIDGLLAYLEDTAHGEEGKRITEMRYRIQNELSNLHKPDVSGKRQLEPDTVEISEKERGCLHCGLTIPNAGARRASVASEGQGEANMRTGTACNCIL